MNLFYQLTHYNDDGIRSQTEKIQSKSFMKAFIYQLCRKSGGSVTEVTNIKGTTNYPRGYLSAIHKGGDTRGGLYPWATYEYNAADQLGIVVGTGTAAVSVDDYALETISAHGTSAGELEYLSCNALDWGVAGSAASFDLERVIYNSSGGTISASEIGIYSFSSDTSVGATATMIVRDLVTPAQDILDAEYLKITYTFSVTV